MSTWLRYFSFWRRDPARDATDEFRFHVDMRVRELMARGISEPAARDRALREFGDAATAQADVVRIDERMMRRVARTEWWSELGRDVRVGLRSLRNNPAFTSTAVITAALGIGVTAAIVSAAYSILVRPLPYADADQLVAIYGENTIRGWKGSNVSHADFEAWRDQNRAFSSIGIYNWDSHTLSDDRNDAERVAGAEVSPSLFQLLGIQPALGRLFLPEEDVYGQHRVVLLGDQLWRRRFAGDSTIVGKAITVDGLAYVVVGVMKPNFSFPDNGNMWVPFTMPAKEPHGNRVYAGAIGRLNPGITVEQGRADLHRIDAELQKQFPEENRGWRAEVIPMRDDLVGNLRQPLEVFLGAVALVLLMVCANVANLMLARSATRAREIAVRSALGASRGRLGRQLMTESLLVAFIGGTLGILIAWWGVRLLRFAFPGETPPFFIQLSLDGTTLVFVSTIALLTGLLFGVVPALRGTKVNLNTALRDGGRGAGQGLQGSRLRSGLVVAEVALSVVLMVGAMLLMRSYQKLEGTDLGFEEQGILSARITLPRIDYPNPTAAQTFYHRLLERLSAVPGVTHVGAAQGVPFSGWDVQGQMIVEGAPPQRQGEELVSLFQSVSPDYFKAIGVPLLKGRWLNAGDRDSLAPAVLINESMARQVFGAADPLGKRIRHAWQSDKWATVVGVIRDFRHYRLPQAMGPATYFAYDAVPASQQTIVIRTNRDDPSSLTPGFREVVRGIDPKVAIYSVQTFKEVVSRSLWRQRLQGNVLGIFAALSLILACIGLYGVVSYAVAQRTRELGVRIALGATNQNVLMLVFMQSGRLVAAGLVCGLVAAYFATGILASLLYGVTRSDPATFAAVPALLSIVALIAALVPARRAARVNPIIAMRAE